MVYSFTDFIVFRPLILIFAFLAANFNLRQNVAIFKKIKNVNIAHCILSLEGTNTVVIDFDSFISIVTLSSITIAIFVAMLIAIVVVVLRTTISIVIVISVLFTVTIIMVITIISVVAN